MQSVDVRHRLLVILAADAADYSRLMALDDVAEGRQLREEDVCALALETGK